MEQFTQKNIYSPYFLLRILVVSHPNTYKCSKSRTIFQTSKKNHLFSEISQNEENRPLKQSKLSASGASKIFLFHTKNRIILLVLNKNSHFELFLKRNTFFYLYRIYFFRYLDYNNKSIFASFMIFFLLLNKMLGKKYYRSQRLLTLSKTIFFFVFN